MFPVSEHETEECPLAYPTFAPTLDHSQLSGQASFAPCIHRWRHCGYTIHMKVVHDRISPGRVRCCWMKIEYWKNVELYDTALRNIVTVI
jgi:hypothetical protein